MLSVCVAAVKCHPVLHHCGVLYFSGPHGLWINCMLFTLEKEFRSCAKGHLSLPLINSFNKTESAIFPMQTMCPREGSLFLVT